MHVQVVERVVPVVAIGDIGDGQNQIAPGQVQHDSRVQGVDVRLDDARRVGGCQSPLVKDLIDADRAQDVAGEVGPDKDGIEVLRAISWQRQPSEGWDDVR